MRIVYFCTSPGPGQHAGGVKVIYDHVRALVDLGVPACVMHERSGYRYPWTEFSVPTIADSELRSTDHVVIPEIKSALIAPRLVAAGVQHSIFVQNGYYLSSRDRNLTDNDVDFAYERAAYILSISDDTSELIRLHYPQLASRVVRMTTTIDIGLFRSDAAKEKLITYMPRKNGSHAEAVVFALRPHLPGGWSVRSIDRLSVPEVAAVLRRSRLFLSFSGMEGLGLPPIEAALCGNYVIGYHGGGGRDYWTAPNFEDVGVGDVADFVRKVVALTGKADTDSDLQELQYGINALRAQFSRAKETACLQDFVRLLSVDQPAGESGNAVSVKLQKRRKFAGRAPSWLSLFNRRAAGPRR
jgi:hypothetical protein